MDTLCEETTALNIINNNVEVNSESNFNYEQLELLSESKPEQMFLSLINNFKHILNIYEDVTVMINITNLFSKIKLLKSSELKTTVLNTIHNTKYLEHLNHYLKDVASIKDISGNKLQEFFNNCKIVLEHVVHPESEELLNEIIQSIQIESNLMNNLETENITQLLNYYRSDKCIKYMKKTSQCYDPIPVYPEIKDINSTTIILSPNIIKGNYKNVSHYVNVQFHLLREDFLSLLRKSIQCYKAVKQYNPNVMKIPNVQIYNNVHMSKNYYNNERLYFANFQTEEDCSSNSKAFMFGSLLVFSDNDFNSMFFGTVININRNESPKKLLKFQLLNKNVPVKINSPYIMFEYDTYFLPYMYAMKALNTFDNMNFPMKSYILNGKTVPEMPVYMRNKPLIYNNNGIKCNILNDDFVTNNTLLGFDSSQSMAFKAALTKQLCIIQGPPGTGKTYVGLRIVKTIIDNMYKTNILKNPIMIISSKNDVLDQFLECLINITDKIVRIGNRCNSNILKSKVLKGIESPSALKILKNSYVIGLTITEASKRHITLQNACCPIVIVEEAADVLEPYLVASLTKYCQHLIMIGDHKQLRPRTASNILAKHFKFDVSLFERMVKNKFPCYTLNTQHRMRPTISALMKPIYPYLKNHSDVKNRSDIFGVTKNLYFINHENREEKSEFDGKSYKNIHEVNFLMEFARYLLKQGYVKKQITILVAYREQLLEFQKIKNGNLNLEDLEIECIDSYQGKENDIILLSLVRNNIDNNIGFLSIPNRVCVALSRARNGLYIMGNMKNLMQSLLWKEINKILVDANSIGDKLTFCCKIHTDCINTVCGTNDFINIQCSSVCNIQMDCGHHCLHVCHHYIDQSHATTYHCDKLYTKLLLCGIEVKIQCDMEYFNYNI